MKVIAFIDKNEVLVRLRAEDFASFVGLTDKYHLGEKLSGEEFKEGGFCQGIVGKVISVTDVFKRAKEALDNHWEATKAARMLEKTAKDFLRFFRP